MKFLFAHRTLAILVGLLCISIALWFVFKPLSTLALFDDIWTLSHQTSAFGEHCTVQVRGIQDRSIPPTQNSRDVIGVLKELSLDVVSHIQRDGNKSYRLIQSSSPLGATDDNGAVALIKLEMIFDGTNEYVRYDTTGPWIAFPKKALADMSNFIQKMFEDQFYFSLDDITKETVSLKEVKKSIDNKEVLVFRGQQTEHSLDMAKQLFQYPIGIYTVREHHGDVIVDRSEKTVLKTMLYTLFEYSDVGDTSLAIDIPVYQECEPVSEKDLDVFAPSDVLWASKEEVQQYLLFKILPK
ncbi:MAG: hypothetical protein AAB400_00585 [Patescibacteria group bacterium]